MRLVTLSASSTPIRTGVLVEDGVIDMTEVGLPADTTDFNRLGDVGRETATEVAASTAPIPLNGGGLRRRARLHDRERRDGQGSPRPPRPVVRRQEFCPMGPAIVTTDELPDVSASWLRTHVNGELRQEAPISSLIFDIPSLIHMISETILLEPGDVIATGTPAGAGTSFDPPRFLARAIGSRSRWTASGPSGTP